MFSLNWNQFIWFQTFIILQFDIMYYSWHVLYPINCFYVWIYGTLNKISMSISITCDRTVVLLVTAKSYPSSMLCVYVRRSYHTVNTCLCYTDHLVMPFSEIITVYSEKHTKCINTFCVQHASLMFNQITHGTTTWL
jgi:hypothetical protein